MLYVLGFIGLFTIGGLTGLPLETRGIIAEWDAAKTRLTVFGATKVLFFNRRTSALVSCRPPPSKMRASCSGSQVSSTVPSAEAAPLMIS